MPINIQIETAIYWKMGKQAGITSNEVENREWMSLSGKPSGVQGGPSLVHPGFHDSQRRGRD